MTSVYESRVALHKQLNSHFMYTKFTHDNLCAVYNWRMSQLRVMRMCRLVLIIVTVVHGYGRLVHSDEQVAHWDVSVFMMVHVLQSSNRMPGYLRQLYRSLSRSSTTTADGTNPPFTAIHSSTHAGRHAHTGSKPVINNNSIRCD